MSSLHQWNWEIPTTLITDAQMGLWVGKADVVLVGADALLGEGSVGAASAATLFP